MLRKRTTCFARRSNSIPETCKAVKLPLLLAIEWIKFRSLHILSGCHSPIVCNMVTERHNIASRMILKVVREGSYVSNHIHMDAGSAGCLAQHDQILNRTIPPYLFDPRIPDQAMRTSSRPNAILVTPCPANPNIPPTPPSHRVLRSMRRNDEVRSSTPPAGQPHELNIQNRHIHLIEIICCKDTRPVSQIEASQQQHSELCKQLQGAEITLCTIQGVGGTIYTAFTLDQF
eukprot:1162021-Pelagomonas_calceolata.AAC.9